MKQFTLQEQQLNLQEQEDNIAAAREVGIKVQATIRNYKDPLPTNLIDRFTTKKGVPKTWGEALDLRVLKQKNSFRNNNPMGSFELEKMK
ncbi:hypothetical protein [Bacillus wiedmannii]|uniref:hypothetical protein n=1 Tax=Bacillus wiedmannii TaxID=1890302 RepID=UPI000BF16B9B|nr:hypothetical protein [Bacillus wiedmannii]MCU5707887.1 hypothetical protein [Bacillus wiedmannii]PEI65441.1 hypothetical protein CN646_25205 [Bacillus wiedmannii]PEK65205.1 hypothetical protein CN595_01475 [Bacillus wiedmannii]PEL55327.1 hypothetical protein CN622_26990 [Bacillus wiedmannii]PEM51586.1 hypothetical protein CN618_11360 [Bacillus wiedmannii]